MKSVFSVIAFFVAMQGAPSNLRVEKSDITNTSCTYLNNQCLSCQVNGKKIVCPTNSWVDLQQPKSSQIELNNAIAKSMEIQDTVNHLLVDRILALESRVTKLESK